MSEISIINHAPGAPGLRYLGLGPKRLPINGIGKLQALLNENTFWAKERKTSELKIMLAHSIAIVSIWRKDRLIGFGRATSDHIYRAVLWDIVIANDMQGLGLGKIVLKSILSSKYIKKIQKVYLMTTYGSEFYEQLGFKINSNQSLMLLDKNQLL